MDFAFLTDVTMRFNSQNVELQSDDKHIAQMIGSVNVFRRILDL